MDEKKILIVEDNEANLMLINDLLEIFDYKVIQAKDAEEGIRLAKSESPDLILMDIGLPGMDGIEATIQLKKDPDTEAMIIVALSAHAMANDIKNALDAGCHDYITKPINTRELSKKVADILNSED